MDTEYKTVVEASAMLSSGVPLLIHAFVVICELGVATYLGVHGLVLLISPDGGTEAQARWGRPPLQGAMARPVGTALFIAGLLILAPVIWGMSAVGSSVALAFSIAFLATTLVGRAGRLSTAGQRVRGAVVFGAVFTLLFLLWEGADPAAQTRSIAQKAMDWRQHEVDWQLDNDRRSPKVGDLAPDFELEDPSGENVVRLATFRGKRPVALVFGSYT